MGGGDGRGSGPSGGRRRRRGSLLCRFVGAGCKDRERELWFAGQNNNPSRPFIVSSHLPRLVFIQSETKPPFSRLLGWGAAAAGESTKTTKKARRGVVPTSRGTMPRVRTSPGTAARLLRLTTTTRRRWASNRTTTEGPSTKMGWRVNGGRGRVRGRGIGRRGGVRAQGGAEQRLGAEARYGETKKRRRC